MKLVFYEDMPPPTPGMPPPSQTLQIIMKHGRSIARKASGFDITPKRKRAESRPSISLPTDFRRVEDPLPGQRYRPLQLSIYLPENRLSRLPEFDDAAFTAAGELQLPQKAVLRARSEATMMQVSNSIPRKAVASMKDETRLEHWRPRTPPSQILESVSEYETLSPSSEVIQFMNLLGILSPPRPHSRTSFDNTMDDPFSDAPTPEALKIRNRAGTPLDFPLVSEEINIPPSPADSEELNLPSNPHTGEQRSILTAVQQATRTSTYSARTNRVSQWLSRSNSVASITSSKYSTRTRENLHIHQAPSVPPQPAFPPSLASHSRSMTDSTFSTAEARSVLSRSSTVTSATTVQSRRSRKNLKRALLQIKTNQVEYGLPATARHQRNGSTPVAETPEEEQRSKAPARSAGIGKAF